MCLERCCVEKDADEAEEVEAQKEALKRAKDEDVKSIDICLMMDEFVKQSSDADEIDTTELMRKTLKPISWHALRVGFVRVRA